MADNDAGGSSPKGLSKEDHFRKIQQWINWALVFGLIGIGVCAVAEGMREGEFNALLRVLGFGVLIAGGGAVGGFLLGFLFAIPRTPDRSASQSQSSSVPGGSPNPNQPAPPVSSSASVSGVNTNLEQISDWLTKIIVGVSLVEFDSILHRAKQFADYMSQALQPWDAGGPYALAVVGLFAPLGFFFGWVITRTYLAQWFDKSDRERAFTMPSLPTEPILSLRERKKVDELLKKNVDEISSTKELADYGIAHLLAGHPDQAIEAFNIALAREPGNPEIRQRKAIALARRGDTDRALNLLQAVRDQSPNPTASAKIDENMVLTYLYEAPPNGFEKALELGKTLEASSTLPHTSWLYVLLAAAFGQKYRFLNTPDSPEAKEARSEALRYVKKALDADSRWKALLQQLWDPTTFKSDPTDNDLELFKNDPDFKALLAPQASA